MPDPRTNSTSLFTDLVDRVEQILAEAESQDKPLEVAPWREQLFELFVTAHGAGFLDEEAEHDLTADALCHELAQRWGLDQAARHSFQQQEKLAPEHLARMRMLWSLMRMWMEWTYAWNRWPEFHAGAV